MTYQVFDQQTALARVDNDMELFREIAALFFDDSTRLLREIRDAIARVDRQTMEKSAHALKGAISNFFATEAFDTATKMEMAAQKRSLDEWLRCYEELNRQVERLVTALWTFSEYE